MTKRRTYKGIDPLPTAKPTEEQVLIHQWVMGKGPNALTRNEASALVAQTRNMQEPELREFFRQKWIDAGRPGR